MSFLQVFLFIIQIDIIYGLYSIDCLNDLDGGNCHGSGVTCTPGEDCSVSCRETNGTRGGCENILITAPLNYTLHVGCRLGNGINGSRTNACKDLMIDTNNATYINVECADNEIACESMDIFGTIGKLEMDCGSCTDTSINVFAGQIEIYCRTRGESCNGISMTGQAGTDIHFWCDAFEGESPGTGHCRDMNIDASLSHDLIITAEADNRSASILSGSNIKCPNQANGGVCIINVTDAHVSALQCAVIEASGPIADFDGLDCQDVQCFDNSDTCGTTVQYFNADTGNSCFITNSDTTWSSFECDPLGTTTAPIPNGTITTSTPCLESTPLVERAFRATLELETKQCIELSGKERLDLIKHILEETMDISAPENLCIALEIIAIRCGSFIGDYTLTSSDSDLLDQAIANIRSAVGTTGTTVFEAESITFMVASCVEFTGSFDSIDSSSVISDDSSTDSSDGMITGAYNSINNVEQSRNVGHVVNNVLIEVNVWNVLGFLALLQISIFGCWYAKRKRYF